MSKTEPTIIETDLVVAERASSLAKARAEVDVPDPETEEEALAAIAANVLGTGAPSCLTVTELDQR